jgi:hypothetical protein
LRHDAELGRKEPRFSATCNGFDGHGEVRGRAQAPPARAAPSASDQVARRRVGFMAGRTSRAAPARIRAEAR